MDFGSALDALKMGHAVCRSGWNGKSMWLEIVEPDRHYRTNDPYNTGTTVQLPAAPYIGMATADRKFVPWLASQMDLLAMDWEVL